MCIYIYICVVKKHLGSFPAPLRGRQTVVVEVLDESEEVLTSEEPQDTFMSLCGYIGWFHVFYMFEMFRRVICLVACFVICMLTFV